MVVILNDQEVEILFRQDPATESDGGFQRLLVSFQTRMDRNTGALSLSSEDLERIPRYAFDYGQGGWEERLRNILERHLGPRLGR
jgi:hypothetical protein